MESNKIDLLFGMLLGMALLLVTLAVLGVLDSPQVKLCDDLATILNTDTQVMGSDCGIRVGEYFVNYSQWIELQ